MAQAQIDTAVRLYLEDKDCLAAITLAGAADEILGSLVAGAGGQNALASLQEATLALQAHLFGEPGDAKWVADRANNARNSLKHLDTGTGRTVQFDPDEEARDMLDRAITNFWRLTQSLTPVMERYERTQRSV